MLQPIQIFLCIGVILVGVILIKYFVTFTKTLHKYLVELGKHIKLDINAEEYKEPFATGYELLILLIVIFWIISEFIKS